MAYHHHSRSAKGGSGTVILFMVLVLAGGSVVAATVETEPSAARVYLAQDLAPSSSAARSQFDRVGGHPEWR